MTHSPLTDQIRISSQSSSRQGATVDTFLIHHQAGMNDDATIRAMVTGSKQVSANYTISNEGRLTCVVDERLRAWTSGSSSDGGRGAAWDRRSITVEIENESGAPDWRISQKAIDKAAALLNDLRRRYTIRNVLGHRDLWEKYHASYPTYCPGPSTVGRIVTRANQLLQTAGGGTTPLQEEIDMSGIAQYFERREGGMAPEWMWGDPTDAALYPKGYKVTTDKEQALLWGRQIAGRGTPPVHLSRALYIAQQQWLTEEAERHRQARIAELTAALSEITVPPPVVNVPPVDYDRIKQAFPTKLTIDIPPATGTLS